MKLFYHRGAEGCILEGEPLDKSPIKLGEYTVKPGTCIKYMGDGRPHRSFEMKDDFVLEYAGMIRFGPNKQLNRILFSVYDYDFFKENNLYYSFIYVNSKMIWLMLGQYGGMRDILLKRVEIVENPVRPKQPPKQFTIFDYMN